LPFQPCQSISYSMSEAVAQLPENPAIEPQSRTGFQITKANASALAAKSLQSRRAKAREHAEYIAKLEAEAAKAREIILAHALANKPVPTVEPEEIFRLEQLARTRKLLESLYSDFETTSDAKERKFISDSIARLSDVEFALARRPKPAAYRTAPEKPKRAGQQSGPVDAD
jgi:hypothetical protein